MSTQRHRFTCRNVARLYLAALSPQARRELSSRTAKNITREAHRRQKRLAYANNITEQLQLWPGNTQLSPQRDTVLSPDGLIDHFAASLIALLNTLRKPELEAITRCFHIPAQPDVARLRATLWLFGAHLEAGTHELVGTNLQPQPVLLRDRLVLLAPGRGLSTCTRSRPLAIETAHAAPSYCAAPDTLKELLSRADNLVGVRLGAPTGNKGAYGSVVAELLGVPEDGRSAPDWRGQVEIKTVPVLRHRNGWWYITEDPAISSEGGNTFDKLRRVLWIARVADRKDSAILGWCYQEADAALLELFAKHLHQRPKGPAGTAARGWYLHKTFFAQSGFLHALNLHEG